MHSTPKPLTDAELEGYEDERDVAADLLQSMREMRVGKGGVVWSPALAARSEAGLSQGHLAWPG